MLTKDHTVLPAIHIWSEQLLMITHRRSIAERGGCFQRHLFVVYLSACPFVCQRDNFRTIKRTTIELGS